MRRAASSVVRWWVLVCCFAAPTTALGEPSHVGIVLDGASAYTDSVRAAFVREIAAYFGRAQTVDFPARHVIAADWTQQGAAAAIDQLLARQDVDIIVALGPVGSNVLAHRHPLAKPAIAALVVDASLQRLPVESGTSGVRNLNYVNVAYTAMRTLQLFHDVVPFRSLAVLIRPGLFEEIPELDARGRAIADSLAASITFVPVTTSAASALAALPPNADAAYLGPAEQLSEAGLDSLIRGLRARRLPTFSFTGRSEVERGTLASYAPKDDLVRRARRVAGNIQRILGGEDAGSLPVDLASIPQLTLNMATAREIGYSPTWVILSEAELLHAEPPASGPTWSLGAVAHEALRASLALQSAARTVEAGRKDVAIARGALFPQAQAEATATMVREESAAASLGQQPERETGGQIGFSLPLLADRKWANLAVEKHRQSAREADRRVTELDAVYETTSAYLDVLRAKALANVERENVKNTRANLELARLRETTGAASRADVYRWSAELANGRRRVLDADAHVRLASLDFNRLLNRPLEEPFQTEDASVADSGLFTSDPRMLAYFSTPERFDVFRDFLVSEGRAASPHLRSLDAAIAAERRAATAARRSFWLPTVALDGGLSSVFSRDGAGASASGLGPVTLPRGPDETWSVRLQGSLPILDGQVRAATLGRSQIELRRLAIERQSVELSVSAQIRAELHEAASTWLGIEQARLAAEASRSNLDLVTDAYSRGATSIITLLDAQEAELSAAEAAANAMYDFLIDLMGVERAIGQFGFFRTPAEREALVRRMDDFYRAAGVAPGGRER
jgi:outer membrane protein TolC/ABC-type uncharacterized transport system substrate-binding protein